MAYEYQIFTNNEPNRAVFLDRDGVINRKKDDYVKTWPEFEFLPGVLDAIYRLSTLTNYLVFVVTNQSCVGRGLTTWNDIETIHQNMVRAVESHGGKINDIAVCPHHPNVGCYCRKPHPGMIFTLARKHGVDLSKSYMIGDSNSDIQAALHAGVEAIHIAENASTRLKPDYPSIWCTQDLVTAVECIVMDIVGDCLE